MCVCIYTYMYVCVCVCTSVHNGAMTLHVYPVSDCKGNLQPFVQYRFDRKEHAVDIKPHGNSKKQSSFRRTKPSTLKLVKKSVEENKRPLRVLREVENIQGGVMSAKSGCDLPQNRRQTYNAKQASKIHSETHSSHSGSVPRSDTYAGMQGDIIQHGCFYLISRSRSRTHVRTCSSLQISNAFILHLFLQCCLLIPLSPVLCHLS